jgi:phospholipase C
MSPTRRAAFAAALLVSVSPYGAMAQASKTATPIEHVIIIVGENHTYDNIFGGVPSAPWPDDIEPAVAGHHRR